MPRDICNFLEQNILQEKQDEWYLQFDPIDTEKRRKVYGSMIQSSFLKRKEQMDKFD